VSPRVVLTILVSLADYLFDSLWLRVTRLRGRGVIPPEAERGGVETALLVRVDQIGDFTLWLPAALRIVEAYHRRGVRVLAVVNGGCADLARGIGVDEVWPLDRDAFRLNLVYRAAFLRRVRRRDVTEVLNPTYSRELAIGDSIVRCCGAARRVGWVGDRSNATALEKRLGDRVYTHLVPNPENEINEVLRNETLLSRLGLSLTPMDRVPLPRRPLAGVVPPERYYVLMPGARRGLRRWPIARFAEIASRLHRETGLVGLICGGEDDRSLAQGLIARVQVPTIDLTGRTDLAQLTAVIAGADLVLSNDTASVHVAASVGTPAVYVLGGGHGERFIVRGPTRLFAYTPPRSVQHPLPCFGCNWICRYRRWTDVRAPCIEAVTVEAVWAAVKEALRTRSRVDPRPTD